MKIPFTVDEFAPVYESFKPSIYKYLCLPEGIKIEEFALTIQEMKLRANNVSLGIKGVLFCSYKKNTFIVQIQIEKQFSIGVRYNTDCVETEYNCTFKHNKYTIGSTVYRLPCVFPHKMNYENPLELTLEFKRIMMRDFTGSDQSDIINNTLLAEWILYHYYTF